MTADCARTILIRIPIKQAVLATGLSIATINKIRTGRVTRIRESTEGKILRIA
jgi:DNA-binding Xre family transcriptional regulator